MQIYGFIWNYHEFKTIIFIGYSNTYKIQRKVYSFNSNFIYYLVLSFLSQKHYLCQENNLHLQL